MFHYSVEGNYHIREDFSNNFSHLGKNFKSNMQHAGTSIDDCKKK